MARAAPGDLYYIINDPPPADGPGEGAGDEATLILRAQAGRPEWVGLLGDRSFVRVNLGNRTRVTADEQPRMVYSRFGPDLTPDEMRAAEMGAREYLGQDVDGPGGGVGGGDGGGGGGAYPALGAPAFRRPDQGAMPPRMQEAMRHRQGLRRGGRGRRVWQTVKKRPLEVSAGFGGVGVFFHKIYAFAQASGTLETIRKEGGKWFVWGKEASAWLREMVKEWGWDGVFLAIIALFLMIRMWKYAFGEETEDAGGEPGRPGFHPQGGDGRRPFRPIRPGGGQGGGGYADMENRMNNFENYNRADHGAGDRLRPNLDGTGTESERKMLKRLQDKLLRVKRQARNPMEVFAKMLEATRELADWPFTGDASERLAGEYLAGVYSTGRRGIYYAREFIRAHGLEGSHQAAVFERIFAILDEMMLYDGSNLSNCAAAEYLCRWAYALGQTFAECSTKVHWQGEKKHLRTRWDLFERYDIWSLQTKGAAKIDNADAAVVEGMKKDAIFFKYLDRVRSAGDGG